MFHVIVGELLRGRQRQCLPFWHGLARRSWLCGPRSSRSRINRGRFAAGLESMISRFKVTGKFLQIIAAKTRAPWASP